jgi:hypothetical protein
LPLSTLLFPLPHLSPLLPFSYAHTSSTVAPQPLCNQSVTHSFHPGEGCTPLRAVPLSFTTGIPSPRYPIPYPLSFQVPAHSFALFCAPVKLNSFVFSRLRTLLQKHRGVGYPPLHLLPGMSSFLPPCAAFRRSSCVFSTFPSVYPLE